jgi:hypothetical protein
MSVLQISYDLGSPESSADYEELINQIKSYDDWKKPGYSLWFIKTNKDTATVRDELSPLLDGNDKLLVMAVSGDGWASWQLPGDVTKWMKDNI